MNPPQKFTHIKHLREFYQPQKQLFIDAQQLPQFFLTNLIDDMRVVKYFHNDPQANITIFYYQYLKLCFEIDNVDYESYIQKIYQLIRTQGFEFYFQPNDPQKEMKNAQYKSLLIDFFEMMNTSSMTIDNVLRQYPILNDVFTNFFRTVVMIASITPSFQAYIDKNELFDFLSSFFSVDISSYDKCLKFVESDIFVYEEDQQNIYMAYIAEEIEGSEDGQHEQGNIKRGSKLLEHEMKTVKEDVQESQVSAGTEQLQIPQIAVRLIQHSATNSTLVPSPDYNINQANAHSLKPRAKTIIKESYIEAQFADYTSFSNNISSFGKNVSAEQQKQVFVEELEPNTTMNETESEGGKRKVFVDGDEDAYELQQKGQKKQQLTRVQSAQHNFLINANRADSLQIEITQPLYNKLQQSHKVQSLTKVNSQPNFLYRQKSLHQLSQSCYQSLDSNIQPQQGQQQVSQKVLRQQFNQQNSNLLQQQQHKSSSKIIISEKNNIPVNEQKMMKKNISSLGLQQQGHMYVSYQQPTKDPGFMEKDLTSRFVQQIGTQQHLQQQQTNRSLYQNLTDYSIYKPSSSIINNNSNIINKNYTTNINSNNNINNNNTATQQSIKLNEPLFYNPTTSTSNLQKQQHQHSSSFPNSRLAQSANSQKQHFYINTNPTSSIKSIGMMNPPIMTQRLKLNVTRQFTNSFVRQSMSEPYKTEVFRTRERAREFRKSIYQQFTSYQMGSSNINNHNFNYQISNNNSNSKVDEYNNYSRPKVDEYNNNTNYSNDYNSYTQHTKKPSSRTSIPSQSSSRKQVTSNRNIQQHQQQKVSPSIKKLQSPQRQQPYHHATSQSSGIYPVSMIKQQNNKVYTYQASLLENSQVNVNNVNNNINNNNNNNVNNNINVNNNNNNNINVNNNNNINNNSENISLLSKISQVKQVSQMISSQSRKSITTMKEDRVIQSTSKLSVNSNNKINVQNSHLVYNNNGHLSSSPSQSSFKKLPTYQPVLLTTGGNKLSVGVSNNAQLQYQQQYQQAQKQQKLQYQQHQQQSPQNYTVHTVMPHHYHHSPQKSNYSNFNQQPQQQSNIDSINMKTFPQQQQGLMMSVIPQTHKPLPLYIPFERRK